VRTLRNAIERGMVHHAYLFVGSRGTGKTSMAKILARSLNCVNGPTATPCGECASCLEIAAGSSLDVIEMDAASNRSVDDIRELRERVGFVPAAGRWKVYILDEAHMLTKEAWNAFLKTLEEPPPNTVFVLATTEAHKVMPTIVDRCQRFDFRRPTPEQVAEVLQRVREAEGIEIDDEALAAISRAAAGSFRDALGTLDQLLAFGGERIEAGDVLAALGVADRELIAAAAEAVRAGDPGAALGAIEEVVGTGRDLAQFGRDLVEHLRELLVFGVTGELPPGAALTEAEAERLRAQAEGFAESALVRAIDAVSDALGRIREGDDERATLEVALLRSAHPRLDATLDSLLDRVGRLEQALRGGAPPEPKPVAKEAPKKDPPAEPSAEVDFDRVVELWPAVIDQVRRSGEEVLATAFDSARPLAIEDGKLRIGFDADASFNKRKAESKTNRERMAQAIVAVLGARLRPAYELLDGPGENGGEEPEQDEQALLDHFKSEFDAEELDSGPAGADEAAGG